MTTHECARDSATLARRWPSIVLFLSALVIIISSSCADGGFEGDTNDVEEATPTQVIAASFEQSSSTASSCEGRSCRDDQGNTWTFTEGVIPVTMSGPYRFVAEEEDKVTLELDATMPAPEIGSILYANMPRLGFVGRVRSVVHASGTTFSYDIEPLSDFDELFTELDLDADAPVTFTGTEASGPMAEFATFGNSQPADSGSFDTFGMSVNIKPTPWLEIQTSFDITEAKAYHTNAAELRMGLRGKWALAVNIVLDLTALGAQKKSKTPGPVIGPINFALGPVPMMFYAKLALVAEVIAGSSLVHPNHLATGTFDIGVKRSAAGTWTPVGEFKTSSQSGAAIQPGDDPEDDPSLSFKVGIELKLALVAARLVEVSFQTVFPQVVFALRRLQTSLGHWALAWSVALEVGVSISVALLNPLDALISWLSEEDTDPEDLEPLAVFELSKDYPTGVYLCGQCASYINGVCRSICSSPACKNACFTNLCPNRNCGQTTSSASGAILGSCGTCTSPKVCVANAKCTTPTCKPDWCGPNSTSTGTCSCKAPKTECCTDPTQGCTKWACSAPPCVPTCTAGACGPDGCGGTCACADDTYACVNEVCERKRDATCQPGTCDNDNGDGQSCPCANTGEVCDNGTCLKTCVGGCGDDPKLTCRGGLCICVPGDECSTKACGFDRCDRACPNTCDLGEVCHEDNCWQCVPQCAATATTPARVCGDDTCGGSCGTCAAGSKCSADQTSCEACVPDCAGKVCGDDGCGGQCGTCPNDGVCTSAGTCQARPLQDLCAGRPPDQFCPVLERDDTYKSPSGKCYCDDYCLIAKDCCTDACTLCNSGCTP